jgi:2'-5' RNA ligase
VPVPEAEPLVGAARAEHDPVAAAGMPAHVTVLYPFAPPRRIDAAMEQALARLFAAAEPFEFELRGVGRFPGVVFLAPEPARPFVALTELVHQRWPSWPPYRGAFAEVVPHLTVAEGPEPAGLADRLQAALPVAGRAATVDLYEEQRDGRWARRCSFPLGLSPPR